MSTAHAIRTACSDDVPVLADMMARYYAEDGYPFDHDAARDALTMLATDPALGWLWLMESDGGQPVGYLAVTLGFSLEYRGRDAFIDELYLLPDARGRGLGRRAVELAEATCRAAGVRALHLEVENDKPGAHAMYRQLGFAGHDRALMHKRLDAGPR